MARIRSNPLGGTTNGTANHDDIEGSAFADWINGGGGHDAISGGKGIDTINGGAGSDKIDGGEGIDTVTFLRAPADVWGRGVSVDLFHGVGHWGDAEGDNYVSIESVTGSRYDDAIRGNMDNNVLNGDEGNDLIAGGGGADTIDGGAGTDTLSYFYFATSEGGAMPQSSGVYVNLATNTVSGGHAQGDVISGFENVMGSAGKDTLIGTDGDNTLQGYSDDDTIDSADGNDAVDGGSGSDTISAGKGDDVVIGGAGNDIMKGGVGADTFVFNLSAGSAPGDDRILDFQFDGDHLRFNIPGPGEMDELTITQVGNDTVITYDDVPGSLTLVRVSVADLSTSNFEFV